MKTKKTFGIILLLLLIFTNFAFSQSLNLPVNYIRNSALGNNITLDEVDGSPYDNDEFTQGDVTINEKIYKGLLRYNAFNDEIQLIDDGQVITLLKRPYVKAAIGTKKFAIYAFNGKQSVKRGYFVELTDNSKKAILLQRITKVILPAEKARSAYKKDKPPRLISSNAYFLSLNKKEPAVEIKLNKKAVLAAFDNHNAELKSFVSKNKLKLKTEDEIAQLLDYYNSL